MFEQKCFQLSWQVASGLVLEQVNNWISPAAEGHCPDGDGLREGTGQRRSGNGGPAAPSPPRPAPPPSPPRSHPQPPYSLPAHLPPPIPRTPSQAEAARRSAFETSIGQPGRRTWP